MRASSDQSRAKVPSAIRRGHDGWEYGVLHYFSEHVSQA